MRLIALEEHFRSKHVENATRDAGMALPKFDFGNAETARRLANLTDLGDRRLEDMDCAGIDLLVISHAVPSPEIFPPAAAIPLAQRVNDELAGAIQLHPKRFAGFATLPVADPAASARELERAVTELGLKGAMINGITQGRFLDDPFFTPILERADALGVPLYLHPAPPPKAVKEIFFSGLQPDLARVLSIAG